ncbi:MAG: hypothetical protein LBH40_05295 [Alphaproteobacteria bacterium]|jgi:hypothetical protein|nr:hypothetical protein [Alphaproteobacteria bacterium]
MRILLIYFLLSLSPLFADGFFIQGSVGSTINSKASISLNNINQSQNFSESTKNIKDETNQLNSGSSRVIVETTNSLSYTSLLKEITYDEPQLSPVFALSGGYTYNHFRFEGELKAIALKVKPRNALYDATAGLNISRRITTYCVSSYCQGDLVDPNDPIAKECPVVAGSSYSCHVLVVNADDSYFQEFNDILVNSSNQVFSGEINKELFSGALISLNANSYLGFMNFLYELPISKYFTLFSGIGLGYGIMAIGGNDVVSKQQITYPAIQYKLGGYYSITKKIDITLHYANINMMGAIKKMNSQSLLSITDTSFQSIELGVRYNLFSKPHVDYNYKKIFSLP